MRSIDRETSVNLPYIDPFNDFEVYELGPVEDWTEITIALFLIFIYLFILVYLHMVLTILSSSFLSNNPFFP